MLPYSIHNDEALLLLLKQSDEKAFTEIYNRYWKKLYAIAWHHLHTKETAEDIVQELFSTLWRRRDMLDIRSLENYLATAIKHSVFHEIAREQKRQPAPFEEAIDNNLADFHFLLQRIEQEVNRLPEKRRIVFRSSRLQGKSNKDIATELHISEKTVEKHLTIALRTLKAQFRTLFSLLP